MKQLILALVISLGVMGYVAVPKLAAAELDPKANACEGANFGKSGAACSEWGLTQTVKRIVNTLLYIIGFLAVVMIIVGALRFVISGGSEDAVKGAKSMILYAVIGLIVAILAYAIVNFVIGTVQEGPPTGGGGLSYQRGLGAVIPD
ncbi:hypothetical protein HY346_03085 [Candidatus Microgenomates bacterium]|nr:hypothetical protein [Candidatus Microgenomates bacterium]